MKNAILIHENELHPNFQVWETNTKQRHKGIELNRKDEKKDATSAIANAICKLERNEIDFICVNGMVMTLNLFLFKTGRLNRRALMDAVLWKFYEKEMDEIITTQAIPNNE